MEAMGPRLPPGFQTGTVTTSSRSAIGPQLPSHGSKIQDSNILTKTSRDSETYGPALPPRLKTVSKDSKHISVNTKQSSSESDDDDDDIGPKLGEFKTGRTSTAAEEIERRAQNMHDRLTGTEKPEILEREEWMMELPPALSKSIGLGLSARTFRKRAVDTDGDRSGWTDTPADKEKKSKEVPTGPSSHKHSHEDDVFSKARDKQCSLVIDKHNKEKRKDSLLEMHQKKRKKDKKEKKRYKDKEHPGRDPDMRRPFDRDEDLKVNKFDDAQRNVMIKKSRDLDTRFNTGKYL